jgi:hypothetical protein
VMGSRCGVLWEPWRAVNRGGMSPNLVACEHLLALVELGAEKT